MRPLRVSISTTTGLPSLPMADFHRQLVDVGVEVLFLLPAVDVEPLPEVALAVEQADADQRDAEIGRALDVVAGEHAQAAGIDRQRFVQAELRGKIRHRMRPQHAGMPRAPGAVRLADTPACGGRRS